MSLKESNEITVKIKCELNEFYKIVKEKGFKIIDKFSWVGSCSTMHNYATLKFLSKNITIDFRPAILDKTAGLKPDYYLLDEGCSYDFCESISYCLEKRGNERLFNMRHLIMKIAEYAMYGDKED